MLSPIDHVMLLIGWTTTFIASLGLVVMLGAALIGLAMRYWPRGHMGVPRNPLHWVCYDGRTILTAKGDSLVSDPKPRLIHDYDVRWWFGLSCRRKPSWWFGFVKVSDTWKD